MLKDEWRDCDETSFNRTLWRRPENVKDILYIITWIQLERKGVIVEEVLPTLCSEGTEE
jgi:hypothetical protein